MGDPQPRDRETIADVGSEPEATAADFGTHGPLDTPGRTLAGELDPGQSTGGVTHAHQTSVAATAAGDATRAGPPEFPPAHRPAPAIAGYLIEGELGRGAMGVVYRARRVGLNRPCALKVILAGAHADPIAAVRFLGEAEAVARLQHPNIVQIHHIGEADGLPFLELEYLEGGSLDRALDGTPWPARRAATFIQALARGVAEAHRLGIIHRDLKPGNILIAADGTPKVADFGLAKSLDVESGLTATDSILGTPGYMAPEQAEGKSKQIGPLADVYALGVILYELLVGRPPFRGTTVLETLQQVKTAEPVPPSRLVPGVPGDAETIALKCLRKDAARRYPSAEALADDLQRFLEDRPIRARRIGPAGHAWRLARRNPAVASLLLLVGFLLAGVAVGATAAAYRLRQVAGAEREARYESEAVRSFLVEDLLGAAAARRATGGPPITIADVLARAESRVGEKFPDHPLVEAAIGETLGRIHYALGQYEPARRHLARAYDLRRRRDPLDRYTIRALESLALAAVACDDPRTLGDLERRTIELAPDPGRTNHVLGLVDAYSIHGRPGRARDLLRRIVDADRSRLGADHPITLSDELTLGFVLREMRLGGDAEVLARQVLGVGRRALESPGGRAIDRSDPRGLAAQLARARVLLRNLDPRSRGKRASPPTIAAPYRETSPVADGKIGAGEYGEGYVFDFTDESRPWRLALQGRDRTKSRDDLSVTLHAAHTGADLFLAFRVRDQFLDNEVSTDPVHNDAVEVYIDGDRAPNDYFLAGGSREGFQIVSDSRGVQSTWARDFFNIDWTVGVGGAEGGYVIEFKIPLDLIDTEDGPGYSPATTGSKLLMNATIVDNDHYVQLGQENSAVLWTDEPALSPFFGREDMWLIELHLSR